MPFLIPIRNEQPLTACARGATRRSPRGWTTPLVIAVVGVGLYVAALAFALQGVFMDDAFIGFRCVRNALAGDGFVFNPGQCVEGVTNLGWLLLLTPWAAVLPVGLAAKLLGGLLVVVAAALAGVAALRLAGLTADPRWYVPVPLLVAAHPDFAFFSLAGMETALLATLIGAGAVVSLRGGGTIARAILGAAAFLVRPEAVLIFPLAVALERFRKPTVAPERARYATALEPGGIRREAAADTAALQAQSGVTGEALRNSARPAAWRATVWGLAVFAGALALITAARLAYFGDVLPNTFYAKSTEPVDVLRRALQALAGSNYNIGVPFVGLLALPVYLAGAAELFQRDRRTAAWLTAATLTGLFFGVYSGLDWTESARYFAPYAPAAFIVLWFGVVRITRAALADRASRGNTLLTALAAGFVLLGVMNTVDHVAPNRAETYPGYVLVSRTLRGPAEWIRNNTPGDAVIATRRIGALGFHADREVFDYTYGLVERDVARRVRAAGHLFEDPHDAALRDLWRMRRPDYLLEDDRVIAKAIRGANGCADAFVVHGLTYRVCRAFRIGAETDWVLCERVADAACQSKAVNELEQRRRPRIP